jgi:hypothetical protein
MCVEDIEFPLKNGYFSFKVQKNATMSSTKPAKHGEIVIAVYESGELRPAFWEFFISSHVRRQYDEATRKSQKYLAYDSPSLYVFCYNLTYLYPRSVP